MDETRPITEEELEIANGSWSALREHLYQATTQVQHASVAAKLNQPGRHDWLRD